MLFGNYTKDKMHLVLATFNFSEATKKTLKDVNITRPYLRNGIGDYCLSTVLAYSDTLAMTFIHTLFSRHIPESDIVIETDSDDLNLDKNVIAFGSNTFSPPQKRIALVELQMQSIFGSDAPGRLVKFIL